MSDLTDALEALVRSKGWRILREKGRAEYGERERRGQLNALKDTDDIRALNKLRQIAASQEAIDWLLNWPNEEIARLKRQEAYPPQEAPTRQPFSPAMAGMSRRGSL